MKKVKFVQDAKLDPGRYYRNPSDVIRDRRLSNEDRLEILSVWERETRKQMESSEDSDETATDKLQQLQRLREDLLQGLESTGESRKPE
jgi:hypothetical protein